MALRERMEAKVAQGRYSGRVSVGMNSDEDPSTKTGSLNAQLKAG